MRFIIKILARWAYVFREEFQVATLDLNANVASGRAQRMRSSPS